MVDLYTKIRRDFWRGVSEDIVKDYIKKLEELKEKLKNLDWDIQKIFNINSIQLERLIDKELEYGNFYLNHFEKKREATFNKWNFVKDRKEHEWDRIHNAWIRTNGKIKAIIKLEKSVSTRVSLEIVNDNKFLIFFERGYNQSKEICYKNLRNEKSIFEETQRLKKLSEKYFSEHQYPRLCPELGEMKNLKELLHISDMEWNETRDNR